MAKKPKLRSRVRIHRSRRYRPMMNHYLLGEIMNIGLEKVKTIEQLRARVNQLAADDKFWDHLADLLEVEKRRDTDYTAARKHMEKEYR